MVYDWFKLNKNTLFQKNGLFPEKIIIYRDGVSNGDFKNVENIEISDLITSFLTYPGNYNPMVSFIIVQKRINTRIFQVMYDKSNETLKIKYSN